MSLRCAAYARYSSDRQSPASIDDQLRVCREYAERQGWEVLENHVYSDKELSGSGADRPGWMRLLVAIKRRPCPFDVLLVDDTSRLCRNLGDNAKFTEEMAYLGIRVVAVSQGIDTESKQAKVLMTFHGLADEMYLEELSSKTHRGLKGRALMGLNTGGRCYGYDNVPVPTVLGADGTPAVKRQVNETEAAIIRRIFQMYSDGGSLKRIAKKLNAEHVPTPQKRNGRRFTTWCPSAVREMLRREMYVGLIIWNRSHFIKKPGTNKRISRERPKSGWLIYQQPELRIIDGELWDRVQNRIVAIAKKYNYGNRPGLANRASTSSNTAVRL